MPKTQPGSTTPTTDLKAPAALYLGEVMHVRLKPFGHRFTYRVMSLLIDLDRLDEARRMSWLFGVNGPGLFSFHERDHGPRDGSPLRTFVATIASAQGIDLAGGKVTLLCYPRLLGYVFNPLSVYFCYDRTEALRLIIYEVRNTFGEIHHYVCPVAARDSASGYIRQSHDKQLYVSPFIEMDARYHFRIAPPSETVKLRILETDAEGPLLTATFKGYRQPLATLRLIAAALSFPLMTLKIIAAIHWEALKLWIKGARLVPRPVADNPAHSKRNREPHRTTPAAS